MKAEFEEKDFEAPLYNELRFGSHRIATPGQVFEGKFGIDAALESEHPLFWGLFEFYDKPRGSILDDLRWGFMWRKLGKKRQLSTFSTNLLVQAKRPQFMSSVPTQLKGYGFSSKYWRFYITEHQQEIPEKISKNLRRRALVVYASPAFHTLDDLYDKTEAQSIVENASFVKVEKLQDHKQWNYCQPGTNGVAHSEPEYIEEISFYSMIEQAKESNVGYGDSSENLRYLYKMAIEACQEIQSHNSIARYYLRLHGRLIRLDDLYGREETFHYVALNLFCNVAKLRWLVL